MIHQTKSIRLKPTHVVLPDGIYLGYWTGHIINFQYFGKDYEIETLRSTLGTNVEVAVEIRDNKITFDKINNLYN
jgi:hypothetical protein